MDTSYQHVGIIVTNEQRDTELHANSNFAFVINFMDSKFTSIDESRKVYPLLSYVEPYGDTYFNHLQAKDLIKELKKLFGDNPISGKDFDLNEVIKILENLKIGQQFVLQGD